MPKVEDRNRIKKERKTPAKTVDLDETLLRAESAIWADRWNASLLIVIRPCQLWHVYLFYGRLSACTNGLSNTLKTATSQLISYNGRHPLATKSSRTFQGVSDCNATTKEQVIVEASVQSAFPAQHASENPMPRSRQGHGTSLLLFFMRLVVEDEADSEAARPPTDLFFFRHQTP